ncbi:Bug family tripartite tricarboxylate transporter substrate binding protein [Sabulicella rubraurantiaca]|uniref:Bug family tripartite tricarboxylate transporter substrate binding protein n=1 Tax=Sabulicella rubraurantiaca TaxID=2811429 RepID=UPI001A96416B|nr:tripartite tricarboxylate transporter substrate binding protein [Sabulicella rubraurantiaca]
MRNSAAWALAAALSALVFATPSVAQQQCSSLTVVAPFPAGSNTDAIARLVGERAAQTLGRPVVIDNKPGAEGQLAAVDVRRAPPDGCRILFATSGNLSILPFIRRDPPYDPLRDFTPLAEIGRYNFFLFVSRGMPDNVQGFVEAARARPGALNFATGNNTNLLAMAEIQRQFGLRLERVNYRGEPPAMTDLMQDRVQAMVATSIGVPHAREGAIRALAVMLPQRIPILPDVPTFTEVGIRDLGIVPWAGFVGPAGLPEATVKALSDALVSAMDHPPLRARAAELGFTMSPSPSGDFARLMREQHEVYGRVIREVGLPVE